MTVTLQGVVDALKARLETVDPTRLTVIDHPVGDAELPLVQIVPPVFDPRMAMASGGVVRIVRFDFQLLVLASTAGGNDEAQESIWGYIDPLTDQSILAVLEADATLGLAGVDAHVLGEVRPLDLEEIAASSAFGALIPFTVIVTKEPS